MSMVDQRHWPTQHVATPLRPTRNDYLLVLFMICLSGNLAFSSGARFDFLLTLGILISGFRLAQVGAWQSRTLLWLLAIYLLFLVFQAFFLSFFAPVTTFGILIRLFFAGFVVASVRWFRFVFVHTMVRLVVLSLLFHVPAALGGLVGIRLYEIFRPLSDAVGAVNTGVNERVNIVVHNFIGNDQFLRNSGMFWEPGAFSGYIVITLLLLATLQRDLTKKVVRKWRRILIVGLLSTMSTTGYLILPFTLFAFTLVDAGRRDAALRKVAWVILSLLVAVPASYYLWQLDFIGSKLTELFNRAIFREVGWELSRFGAAIFDWAYIQERPVFGWGKNNATQFSLNPEFEDLRLGNGLSGYLRQMGVLGLGIYVVFVSGSLARLGVSSAARYWVVFVVVFQLSGQYYMDYPIFLALHFLGLERRPMLMVPQERTRLLRHPP